MNSRKALGKTDFEWVTKKVKGASVETDVTISIVNNSRSNLAISFIFRNDIDKLISPTGYIVFALKKNRIYFKEADNYDGYKLVSPHVTKSVNFKSSVPKDEETIYSTFAGNYSLKYDEFNELFYIEKAKED